MRKLILGVLAVLGLVENPFAQNLTSPVGIGDKLPNIPTQQVFNYKAESLSLANFRGKLVIIDFWLTTCGSCVHKLPLLDSLQKHYGSSIQVLLVTPESRQKVADWWEKKDFLRNNQLPVITGDTLLNSIFPHKYVSHVVWAGDGTIKAITGSSYILKDKVAEALAKSTLRWPVKVDRSEYDPSRPLLEELNRGEIKYYSAFSRNLEGLPTTKGQQRDSAAGTIRSYFVNWNLYRVYMLALGHFLYYPPNHMVWKVKDRNRYLPTDSTQPYDDWRLVNNFCYESVLPLNMSTKERMATLIADLNRYSGSNVRKEMQWRDCWLVVKSEEAPKAPMPNSFGSCATPCPSHWHLSLKDLLFELNDVEANPPVIDSSGHTGPFDLVISREDLSDIASLKKHLSNISNLRKHLQPLGLDIVTARRQVEVIVIEEVGEADRR